MDEQRIFLALDAELKRVTAEHANALAAFQKACPHDRVLETPMRDGWGTTNAPMRVCETCGVAERGWHCGYGALREPHAVPQITHERFEQLRRGPVTQWVPGRERV